jgi:protein-disulfide isomerase
MAAGEQGKFWEMHDLLFKNQKQMKPNAADMKGWTAGLAKQLGLDVEKYKKDFDNPAFAKQIETDMKLGSELGVRGTPHFFVNGTRVSGAQPLPKFEEIVKTELAAAKKLAQAGVAKDQIYGKRVAENFGDAPTPQAKGNQPAPATVVQMVPVNAGDPIKGNTQDPLITIVEFSDFQCPFCSRVNPTIDQIMKSKEYGDKVRIAFKQTPLPFHKEAPIAHEAALAANEQGKFWEYHDALFAKQKEMKANAGNMNQWLEGIAQEVGLNMSKFKSSLESGKYKAQLKADQELGAKVGARGTPNFFVNGVQVVGAKPFPAFDSVIKEQLKVAQKIKKEKGLKGDKLYAAIVDYNKKNAPKPAAAAPQPDQPDPKVDVAKLSEGNAFTKGPKNAPITIVEFSDFQCPFCARGTDTLNSIYKEYDGKIRVVFKAFPLPFHKEAPAAHRGAIAAGKQGKFWEYHDKLFSNVKALKEPGIFKKYAQELGLNMAKWEKDFNDPAVAKQVDDEMKQGQAVGVRGTPAFFINGTRLVGAQPPAKFKAVIDAELQKK